MFLSKLNTVRQSLTPAEEKVAAYILEHGDVSRTITSQKLAESTGIGQSTIIRFSRKLGYHSFRELLADIAADGADARLGVEIDTREDAASTLQKIATQTQEIVALTLQNNTAAALEQAVSCLSHATEVIIFGIESSNLFAKYLANQLIKLGIGCVTSESAHTTYLSIAHANKQAAVCLISESGRTQEVLKAAQLAKERGLPVIAMTRNRRNPLYEYADIVLKTIAFEAITRLNVTTMRASQLYLIDALYLLIMKSDFERYNQRLELAEGIIGRNQ